MPIIIATIILNVNVFTKRFSNFYIEYISFLSFIPDFIPRLLLL